MTYSPGHPWHYVLGGRVLLPRDIWNAVRASGYRGCAERAILAADTLPEPRRSADLRRLRQQTIANTRRDISRYRECASALRRYRAQNAANHQPACADVHVSISLKHNHLYNDFAHMDLLNGLLSKQRDLFGF